MQLVQVLSEWNSRANLMSDASEGFSAPVELFVPIDAPLDRRKNQRNRVKIPFIRIDGELAIYSSFDDLSAPIAKLPLRLVLSDITPSGMGIYSEKKFYPGACVSIHLPLRDQFYVKAKVVWCREALKNPSHIMAKHRFKYRIGLEFYFASEAEKHSIRVFIDKLMDPKSSFMQVFEQAPLSDDVA
jgi:hypothetical protein